MNERRKFKFHQNRECEYFPCHEGIPEEDKLRIFNKFYQLDSSHKQEGNGLGLSLAKQIIDSCGGDICVETPENGGCRFVVIIPAAE